MELIGTNGFGNFDASSSFIVDSPPLVFFTVSPGSAPVGIERVFNPNGATDFDGEIVLYEFDFDGDGTFDWNSTTPQLVSYTYYASGTYLPTLRVTDDDGYTRSWSQRIYSRPVLPVPEFGVAEPIIAAVALLSITLVTAILSKKKNKAVMSA